MTTTLRKRSNAPLRVATPAPVRSVTLPSQDEVSALLERANTDGAKLATQPGWEVKDDESCKQAAALLRQIAKLLDATDGKRKEWLAPAQAIVSEVNRTLKPVLDDLSGAEHELKEMIGAYCLDAPALPALDGVTIAVEWTGEVVDVRALPSEFVIPDVKKLEGVTKAMAKDPGIRGWKAYPRCTVRTSRK